jgi:hypothetical protein
MAAAIAWVGCATPYAYTFHVVEPGVRLAAAPGAGDLLEDADLRTELKVDPAGPQAIVVTLTNKTEQVLQVRWAEVTLLDGKGGSSAPRPDQDLGWIPAGATQTARLVPFALPDKGSAAAAHEGRVFELVLPLIVRRESRSLHVHLAAHVQERK